MKKKVISLIFAAALFMSLAPSAAASNHPFAQALNTYLSSAQERTSAVLYDLDRDGSMEMIVVEESQNIRVYGLVNGELRTSILNELRVSFMDNVFISNRGQLVIISEFSSHGIGYHVYDYSNGVARLHMSADESWEWDDPMDDSTDKDIYTIDGVEVRESVFRNRLYDLGINMDDAALTIRVWDIDPEVGPVGVFISNHTNTILAMTAAPAVSAGPSGWAQENVTRAIGLGLVPASFQSNYQQPTTRAEFAALAVTLYETVTGSVIAGRLTFSDTNDLSVQKAAFIGVVQGVGNNRFNPGGTLNRQEAATMLSRLAEAVGSPLPNSQFSAAFSDMGGVAPWARVAVGQVQEAGIMQGTGNNMFSPTGSYTREQSIATMLRLFDSLMQGGSSAPAQTPAAPQEVEGVYIGTYRNAQYGEYFTLKSDGTFDGFGYFEGDTSYIRGDWVVFDADYGKLIWLVEDKSFGGLYATLLADPSNKNVLHTHDGGFGLTPEDEPFVLE